MRAPMVLLAATVLTACGGQPKELRHIDEYTIQHNKSYLKDYTAVNEDGTVNVVVEIPAGTTQKWEVDKTRDDQIIWTWQHQVPRIVDYLPYPGNYGTVPRTLMRLDDGGDGDPLDILVLGSAVKRGSVIPAKIIGVLRMKDKGQEDDKLIAVPKYSTLSHVNSLAELEDSYPGVLEIVRIWFANYKGSDKITIIGYEESLAAKQVLRDALVGVN